MLTNLELFLLNLKIKSNDSTLKIFISELRDCDNILKVRIVAEAGREVMNNSHAHIHSSGLENLDPREIALVENAEILKELSISISNHSKTLKEFQAQIKESVEKFN